MAAGMILVPELQTVVILVPRTGTSALKRALLTTYPKAMQLYRHMEADGVPYGYDRWKRVGVVREPIDRLWSLYRFLKWMGAGRDADGNGKWEPAYIAKQRASVDRSFSDWLVQNNVVFTSPYDTATGGKFYPGFAVHHPLPETRKSQFIYLRPDLGTEAWPFERLAALHESLGIEAPRENHNEPAPMPELTAEAVEHMHRWFAWDLETTGRRLAA
jgi:hypothetical protein